MRAMAVAAAVLLAGIAPAHAAEARDFCPDRPGLGTPACTIDPRRLAIEIGLGDWTHESNAATRTDTIVAGDMLLRYGLGEHLEAQLGWAAYGHVRERDRATGAIDRRAGTGDVTIALRRSLTHPDGSGFSMALMPYASLPTGRKQIGAGDWGVGLIAPIGFALSDTLSLNATPEIDAAVDEDGEGRHLAYGGVVGVGLDVSQSLQATLEFSERREDDAGGHATEALAALSLAWQPDDDLQIDIGSVAGLNRNSPDAGVSVGVARRF